MFFLELKIMEKSVSWIKNQGKCCFMLWKGWKKLIPELKIMKNMFLELKIKENVVP